MKKGGIITIIIIVLILLIGIIWYFGTYNKLVSMKEEINSSWAEIDNQLLRRADLVPNLVNTVKGYASHEKEIFTSVAEARSKLIGAGNVKDKINASNELDGAISRLLMITENYPQLKADKNFTQLMDELSGTENRIAYARKKYNDSVKTFNKKIKMIPTNMIANSLGYEEEPYYEVPETKKEVPNVQF